MRKSTADIVGELIAQLTFTEEILECNVVAEGLELKICDTHGLTDRSLIVIDGQDVIVEDVIDCETILIPGTSCPTATEITIPAPRFIHGTIKAVSDELLQIKSNREKFQIVYLYEVLQETRNRNPEDVIGREADLIMFFITVARGKGELTDDKYREYIQPMDNLCEDFVDLLEESPIIGSIEEENYTIIPHTIAGFYDRLGHIKDFFNEKYSGVEFRISLPIEKNGCKECKHN